MKLSVLFLVLLLTQISVNALGGLAKPPVRSAWQRVKQKGEITVRNIQLLRKLKSRLSVNSLAPILSEIVRYKVGRYLQGTVSFFKKGLEKLSKSPEMQKIAVTVLSDCCKYALVIFLIQTLTSSVKNHVVNVLEYVDRKELEEKKSSTLTAYLQPNVTLNAHELEIFQTIEAPDVINQSFENIGGLTNIKESLMFEFPRNITSTTSGQVSSPRSMLLFGPPGCGKSMIARALSRHLNVPLLKVLPSTLMRKYVGETSQLTKALFTLVQKLTACVVFIDEADALFSSRENNNHMVDRQLVTEFMQLWDELARTNSPTSSSSSSTSSAVCILGATNRPQDLDPAILRRFDRSYYIPPPDLQARYEVLKKHLHGVSLQKDCNLALCATRAAGFTSSDLAAACRDAVRHQQMQARKRQQADGDGMVQPLSTQDILNALKTAVPVRWSAAAYARYSQASNHPAFNTDPTDAADSGDSNSGGGGSADSVNSLDLSYEKDNNCLDAGMNKNDEMSAEVYGPDEEEEDFEDDKNDD